MTKTKLWIVVWILLATNCVTVWVLQKQIIRAKYAGQGQGFYDPVVNVGINDG